MARSLVVFDGDDTLWWSEPLYDAAREDAKRIVGAAGLDAGEWERLERRLDVANVPRFGLTARRFPTSCVEAYQLVAEKAGRTSDEATEAAIRAAAQSVFQKQATVAQGAFQTLAALASFADLALLTKGDPHVQERRIKDSKLGHFFSLIEIVNQKSDHSFLEVLRAFRARPEDSWSVGNSMASDILPALSLGMNVIWIDAHVWEHERRHDNLEDQRILRVDSLQEVPPLIQDTSVKRQRA